MLPIYDLNSDTPDNLVAACEQWGFFELRGHDLSEDLMKEALTVLLQDEIVGLQVYHDDRWYTVPGERVRISIPYFLNPDYAYDFSPLGQVQPR